MTTEGDAELDIPPEVAERLGYYVYQYKHPDTNKVFYVGKGKGRRALAHLGAAGESRKVQVISELKARGLKPRIEILAHALPNEETAFRIEAAVIDAIGLDSLTNLVSGWGSIQYGLMPLSELVFYYGAKPIQVEHPALLIRINRLYRHGMSPEELFDATRGRWKIGPRRERAKYALAVFQGVVREVYEIEGWDPAGTTMSRMHADPVPKGRWEFRGKVASEPIHSLYYGKSVAAYFKQGMQSPVIYVKCGDAAADDADEASAPTSRVRKGTTEPGYENRNRQVVVRATGLPGTDHLQSIYILRCSDCEAEYGANGSDIFQRKCPTCQGGAPGLDLG